MRQPERSKPFFMSNPQELQVYVDTLMPDKSRVDIPERHLSHHAEDWFELYYTTANRYAPDNLPWQPNRLQGLFVAPYSGADTEISTSSLVSPARYIATKPILALTGFYVFTDGDNNEDPRELPPVALEVSLPDEQADYLSYRSAYDDTESFQPLSDDLSIDVARIMKAYFSHIKRQSSPHRGL